MEFLVDDPSVSRLAGFRTRQLPASAACWALLPAVLCALIVGRRIAGGLREARLMREGRLGFAHLAHTQRLPARRCGCFGQRCAANSNGCCSSSDRWMLTYEFTEEEDERGDGGDGARGPPSRGSMRGSMRGSGGRDSGRRSVADGGRPKVVAIGGEFGWQAVYTVTLRVDDTDQLARVTDEALEPVLYLASDPSVAMLMDALPPSVRIDPALGVFLSDSWVQELAPPVIMLVLIVTGIVAMHLQTYTTW
jgi:hypothetical protein